MEIFKELLANSAFTALIAFIAGFIAQLLLRMQVNWHEVKKEKIQYEKQHLENLKKYAEQLISQMMAYDEFANFAISTINHGIHDQEKLEEISLNIKKIKEELSPKLQIHFYELTDLQNRYSEAIASFNKTFTNGLMYEGPKQKGWNSEEIEKLNVQLNEVFDSRAILVKATLQYLKDKEEVLFTQ